MKSVEVGERKEIGKNTTVHLAHTILLCINGKKNLRLKGILKVQMVNFVCISPFVKLFLLSWSIHCLCGMISFRCRRRTRARRE